MMNIEDIYIGQSQSASRTFSQGDVLRFAQLSGDTNPLHCDEEYAASSRFGRIIVPGMLTASLFSGIIGTQLPGIGSIYLSQNLRFLHPVYPDIEVKATVEVVAVDKAKSRVSLSTTLRDTEGTLLIDGTALILLK
ncbi:MAG: MaoC family dehydratase [Bacteroidales bacterium]|nr:MaoC family dehydratase [Bacteroidales bacterium]